jgi:patatin-related protein
VGTPAQGSGQTRELRLALVCYGGSSLAIYMHGVTKELHRLVKASAGLESPDGPDENASPSERVYAELLTKLAADDPGQVQTRVVVDVIAGTSAGGINGICLAKALAHDLSLDGFRDLWFERGDIDGLLAAPGFLPRPAKAAYVAARALKRAPLRGDLMAQWIWDAFSTMDGTAPPGGSTLMPDRHLLELFVTITDFYGYGRQVPYADPNPIQDSRHRHLLNFRYGGDDGNDDFGPTSNGALTFAARTTSCIPGVFPPVSFEQLKLWLGQRGFDEDELTSRFFRIYELANFPPGWTWFVDGGVLDNKPFGPAIQAIRQRPADLEVDRRLLYLEPDPGEAMVAAQQVKPGTLAAAIGGLTGLPRAEPILDDLVEVGALNERVRRIKDIVDTGWEKVEEHVRAIIDPIGSVPDDPDSPQLAEIRRKLDDAAKENAGFSYATYVRMKISGVIDGYAETACAACNFPPDSTHALLTRSSLRNWAERENLFEQKVDPTERQLDFLKSFDLGYGIRRLSFVIAGLNLLYKPEKPEDAVPRDEIDAAKGRVWAAVGTLRDAAAGTGFDAALEDRIRACFDPDEMREVMQTLGFDVATYVDGHLDQLAAIEAAFSAYLEATLTGFTSRLYSELVQMTAGWKDEIKWKLLVRYLGFPFWDVLLYPVQALSDVGERDHVEIIRISPRDTHLIPVPPSNGDRPKLVGAETHHFGAFLSRRGREQDYLWGRLDGAERLIGILLETRDPDDPEKKHWCNEAFRAILAEDAGDLPNAAGLVAHVRETVDAG